MHDIEPYYNWREWYVASEDEHSPLAGREYSEFEFTHTIYNYYIHPQWDEFGSSTLYLKILFVDYETRFAIIEFIGEWNDCLYNDIMYLKENILDSMIQNGICKFVFICENVLNFHGSDDCYYEAIHEDLMDEGGWMVMLNLLEHVEDEMRRTYIQAYANMFNDVDWRRQKPQFLEKTIENLLSGKTLELN